MQNTYQGDSAGQENGSCPAILVVEGPVEMPPINPEEDSQLQGLVARGVIPLAYAKAVLISEDCHTRGKNTPTLRVVSVTPPAQ